MNADGLQRHRRRHGGAGRLGGGGPHAPPDRLREGLNNEGQAVAGRLPEAAAPALSTSLFKETVRSTQNSQEPRSIIRRPLGWVVCAAVSFDLLQF